MMLATGLGAGMNLAEVGRAGVHGFFYTVIGISLTMSIGLTLGWLIRQRSAFVSCHLVSDWLRTQPERPASSRSPSVDPRLSSLGAHGERDS